MTLTETFQSRIDAIAHAQRQQAIYAGARVLVSGCAGGFTVMTTLKGE